VAVYVLGLGSELGARVALDQFGSCCLASLGQVGIGTGHDDHAGEPLGLVNDEHDVALAELGDVALLLGLWVGWHCRVLSGGCGED
jgi:hypothetical protein